MADQRGHVVDYNAHRGLGTVERDDGRRFGFHCTAIDDGTRDVAAGIPVTFTIVAGHLGVWEAARLRST